MKDSVCFPYSGGNRRDAQIIISKKEIVLAGPLPGFVIQHSVDINSTMRIYYLLFFKLSKFFLSWSDEGGENWKALIVVGALQVIYLLQALVWFTIWTKSMIQINPYLFAIPIGLGLTILNYFIFLHNDTWRMHFRKFEKMPAKKSIFAGWLVSLFILFSFASLIYSFYCMSTIDWSIFRK